MSISRNDALKAVRVLLSYIGEDPDREGLRATPERVIRAWEEEWGAGYREPEFTIADFDNEGYSSDQMIFLKDISFVSFCEHHMAPLFGVAHVAYLPKTRIVGISKLGRVVHHFARRLQVQERLTAQIADFLSEHVSPNCAVTLAAQHMCLISRGIKEPNTKMITTALRGRFREDAAAQDEFLRTVRANGG